MSHKKTGAKLALLPAKLFPLRSKVFPIQASPLIIKSIGPIIITIIFLILTLWSWGKWPDLLKDFGRELYIPWQINSGKVLYKDIAYRHGPLSPYLNAIWFFIFGVSLNTLIYCNLAIVIILLIIIFYYLTIACDKTTALIASIVFLCTAAFPQLIYMGSFNFVCPYDHSLTHGIFFSFITILCLSYFLRNPCPAILFIAGLSCGLVFLTKAEAFGALAFTVAVGMMRFFYKNNIKVWIYFKNFTIFIIAMIIPIFLFLVYFFSKMPFIQALKGILGDWAFMYGTPITNIHFFKGVMGTDKPIFNISLLFLSFLILTFITWGALKLDKGDFKNLCGKIKISGIFLAFLVLLVTIIKFTNKPIALTLLDLMYRPILLINMLSLIIIIFVLYKKDECIMVEKVVPFVLLNIFGMLLLGKIVLNCRIEDYGFALTMPAMLINVAFFVWIMPQLLLKMYGGGNLFRKLSILGLLLLSIVALIRSDHFYNQKDYLIGKGADSFFSYGPKFEIKGLAVNKAVEIIKETTSPDDNFTPLPEGLMINYLMRRPSLFRYDAITPGELTSYGETAILESLKSSQPKFILLIHRGSIEFGVGYFGSDTRNGKLIMEWVNRNYKRVWQIYNEPLKNGKFGMIMLQKVSLFDD